ncbi:electron transfer flavoprotein-quinone oxidoreductase [Propionispira arboris]|uniref:Electron transfer flavoprotein-quinone oxidoreductase n=1 Tax=Propionispira arboris TaxID=84035 RepID=A0A1H6VJI4_9FIRM|nr:FAD-dependent oxidoreductase [Propionispira arboris]SEJ00920.1 electron transfer flavoprotein-quinone oxidoreductase [Propionispira arboris]
MEDEKFDVIIVGAGPAGSACAYILAREGKSVLMIERGDTAGSKNVTGGRLYTYALELVESNLYKEAILERAVVREQIMMLSDKTGLTIDYFAGTNMEERMPQSYTILRAPFDEWFAGKAEEQGAMIAAGILVDELIEKDGKIVGVKAGGDEMYADLVIAADGVNSSMARQAGLKKEWNGHEVGIGVKEVIELDPETIQQRFNIGPDEGVARAILGGTDSVMGGGCLYTNKDTISLGVVLSPASLAAQKRSIADIYQDFKMHPAIYPLIKDGTTVEYSAHLVPENGWNSVPKKLYRDGFLMVGDAAGFVINTGTMIRGIDLAIVSGVAAARAVLKAAAPADVGQLYMKELNELQLISTMQLFAGWPQITGLPRMSSVYPDLANEMIGSLFYVDGKLPKRMDKSMLQILRKHVGIGQVLADAWKGFKAL